MADEAAPQGAETAVVEQAPAEPQAQPENPFDFDDPTVAAREEPAEPAGDDEPQETDAPADGSSGEGDDKAGEGDAGEKIAEELQARAEAFFSKEEIAELGKAGNLERMTTLAEARLGQFGRQLLNGEAGDQKPAAGAAKPAEKAAEPEKKPEAEAEGQYQPKLNPENFDAEVIEEFKRLNGHYNGVIEKLQNQVDEAVGYIKKQEAERFDREFEGMIDALPKTYEVDLGKGPGSAMDKKGQQYQNRGKIFAEMEALATGYKQVRGEVPSIKKLFEIAVRNVFPTRERETVRKEIGGTLEKRGKQTISRPSQRRSTDSNPIQAATKTAESKLAAMRDRGDFAKGAMK